MLYRFFAFLFPFLTTFIRCRCFSACNHFSPYFRLAFRRLHVHIHFEKRLCGEKKSGRKIYVLVGGKFFFLTLRKRAQKLFSVRKRKTSYRRSLSGWESAATRRRRKASPSLFKRKYVSLNDFHLHRRKSLALVCTWTWVWVENFSFPSSLRLNLFFSFAPFLSGVEKKVEERFLETWRLLSEKDEKDGGTSLFPSENWVSLRTRKEKVAHKGFSREKFLQNGENSRKSFALIDDWETKGR